MKNLVIILFLLASCLSSSLGQSRFPLQSNSKWNMFLKEANYQCEPQTQDEYYSLYFNGDTIINEIRYYKLYKSGTAYYDEPFVYTNIYMGALRDANNQFLFIEKDKTREMVLYDFTKGINDTIFTGINQQFSIIHDIDTLEDGRKMFLCRSKFQWGGKCSLGYIIEGVGGIGGLLYDMPCDHPGLREHFLICYSEGSQLKYKSFLTNCSCELETSAFKEEMKASTCYPNPASGKIKIQNSGSSEKHFTIVDLNGKLMKKGKLNAHDEDIDIQELQQGVYFLFLTSQKTAFSYKIIVK